MSSAFCSLLDGWLDNGQEEVVLLDVVGVVGLLGVSHLLAVPGKDVLPPQCIGNVLILYCIAIVLQREKVLPILIAFLKSGAIVLQYN
jgi:hypothetical protein